MIHLKNLSLKYGDQKVFDDLNIMIQDQDRIAQLVVAPVWQADFEVTTNLSQTARGAGGFGSTGVSQ